MVAPCVPAVPAMVEADQTLTGCGNARTKRYSGYPCEEPAAAAEEAAAVAVLPRRSRRRMRPQAAVASLPLAAVGPGSSMVAPASPGMDNMQMNRMDMPLAEPQPVVTEPQLRQPRLMAVEPSVRPHQAAHPSALTGRC